MKTIIPRMIRPLACVLLTASAACLISTPQSSAHTAEPQTQGSNRLSASFPAHVTSLRATDRPQQDPPVSPSSPAASTLRRVAASCGEADPDWRRYASWTDAYARNVPIRCGYWNGVKGWGVQKLKAKSRWNVWYRGMIGSTLENPRDRWAQNPTTDIYVTRWFTECDPVYRFRVVVNTSRKSGHTGMMGVVNAYMEFR